MDIFIYLVTTLLAIVGLFIGLSTNLFWITNDPIKVQFGSFAFALVSIILGDRLVSYQKDKALMKIIKESLEKMPIMDTIKQFSNCNEALEYISSRLHEATVVLNTRVSGHLDDAAKKRNGFYNKNDLALKSALKGGLVFKDVVSEGFREFSSEIEQHCGSKYKHVVLKSTTPSFLNFTILDFDSEEELLFGWANSTYMGSEQKAYLVRDKRVIGYFKQYHQSLFTPSQGK